MREKEKTGRPLIGAACPLFMVASLVVVSAPAEKEAMSLVLGAALIVIALGAIGAATFRIKAPGVEVRTNGHADSDMPRPRAGDDVPASVGWIERQRNPFVLFGELYPDNFARDMRRILNAPLRQLGQRPHGTLLPQPEDQMGARRRLPKPSGGQGGFAALPEPPLRPGAAAQF